MTPEQNERWRAAINPLDYLDHHALTREGLREFDKRIKTRRGVPLWALRIRLTCLQKCWTDALSEDGQIRREPWVPQFALRSEIAMAGLKVLYPRPEERVELYRRLLLDFIDRALVEIAVGLQPLQDLRKLCREHCSDRGAWADLQDQISFEKGLRYRCKPNTTQDRPPERIRYEIECLQLGDDCLGLALFVLFADPERWWLKSGPDLRYRLAWMQQRRLDYGVPHEAIAAGPDKLVADAFLAALEAECPPPDWLPTT